MMGLLVALLTLEMGMLSAWSPARELLVHAQCTMSTLSQGRPSEGVAAARCPCGEVCDDDVRDEDVVDRDAHDEDVCDGCNRPDPDDPDDGEDR